MNYHQLWRVTFVKFALLVFGPMMQCGASKSTHACMFERNHTLPIFFECGMKQHSNGSWIQSVPKLIPAFSADNACYRARSKFGVPQGYRTCIIPDTDKTDEIANSPTVTAGITQLAAASDADRRPRDCSELQTGGPTQSGMYPVYPDGAGGPLFVYCDMETDGGGWTLFQRRQDGSVDFFLYWSDYKHGFGNVSAEHWLGNDMIHRLTTQRTYELRVDLEDFEGETRYATYREFRIANEDHNYTLTLGDYSGNAGDSLTYHADHAFSTRDRDNDRSTIDWENCAARYMGAWWYGGCHRSNLNGPYLNGTLPKDGYARGIIWSHWRGFFYSLKETEMKIRPVST